MRKISPRAALVGAFVVCISACNDGGEQPDSQKADSDAIFVQLASVREDTADGPDAAWSGRLVDNSGCLAIDFGNGSLRAAVFYSNDKVSVDGDGRKAVIMADGSVLEVGREYEGLQTPIDSILNVPDIQKAQECSDALGTQLGSLIRGVNP